MTDTDKPVKLVIIMSPEINAAISATARLIETTDKTEVIKRALAVYEYLILKKYTGSIFVERRDGTEQEVDIR